MPTSLTLTLHYSGQFPFEQEKKAALVLAETSESDHAARARLLAIVAIAQVLTNPGAAGATAREAVLAAESAGDDVSRAWGLIALCATNVSPASLQERVESARAVLRTAQESGEEEFVSTAYFFYLGGLTELGAIDELDLALSPSGELLAAFPWLEEERHVAWFRCFRMTLDGQADHAERLAHHALRIASEEGDPDAESVFVGQLAIIRWMQGRVIELEPAFLQARQSAPHEPVWAVSLAWMWLRQGRQSAARALVTSIAPIDALPLDRNWLATASILAVVAAELGERDVAAQVQRALLPFEGRLVTMGLGVTTWGTVSRPLALLARALGDEEGAIRHYRAAVELSARVGAHPWLAEAQTELAEVLAQRGAPGDREEALSLLGEAIAAGRALQLSGIEEPPAAALAALQAADEERTEDAERIARPSIRVLGVFDVVSAEGVVAQWQSRKARQLLHLLVAKRGVAVSRETIMHQLWPDEAPAKLANRFAVAVSTIRRALDPEATHPTSAFLQTRGGLVRLCSERLDVDVEDFLALARRALALPAQSSESLAAGDGERTALLTEAFSRYGSADVVSEADWASGELLQRDVHVALFEVCHALAEASAASDDQLTRVECYRRILAIDPYDQRAHEGLVAALAALGSTGQLGEAQEDYRRHMGELGIDLERSA